MAFETSPSLIEAAKRGCAAQIDELIAAIWPDTYRLAYAILGERQAAEDAAQEGCIALYRGIGSLQSVAAFRVWFYRVVVREASAAKRKRGRAEPEVSMPAASDTWAASLDVWRALAALPQHLRDVVVLRYFEDLSSREIADILRVPSGTVRFRLSVAMKKMRPLVAEAAGPHGLRAPMPIGVRAGVC